MKKILTLALALGLATTLAACGGDPAPAASAGSSAAGASAPAETVTLKVAASTTPHAEILAAVKDDLAAQGIDLQVTEYSDYVAPNLAVEDGDEDANYFQHQPYLDEFNAERDTHLVGVAKIHYEPMGIYAGKTASIDALADGAKVAVPNDATNEARALLLLEAQGLIKVDPDAGLSAKPSDILENPKNLTIYEMDAQMIPTTLTEVDLSVINSNYALQAQLNPAEDALASEDPDSDSAQTYANIIAVKEGRENDPAIVALVAALQSETARTYINDTYSGAVVPVF